MFNITLIQGRFRPQIICDVCHKEITDKDGHITWGFDIEKPESGGMLFVHKGQCDRTAKHWHLTNGLVSLWMPLRDFLKYLMANSMIDHSEDLPFWANFVTAMLSIYGENPNVDMYDAVKDITEPSGIYFLWNQSKDQLDYIGQSISIKTRLYNHQVYNKSIHTIGVSEIRNAPVQEVIEVALIGLLNPKYNRKWRTDLG